MKKVIYCLGAIALVAGLVGDANGLKSFPAGGQMVDGPRNESRSYNAKTKQTIVTNHNTAISYIERNAPNPSVAEHTPLAYASKSTILSSNTPTPRTGKSQVYTTRSSVQPSSYIASSSQVSNQSKSVITIPRKVPEAPSPSHSAFQELPMNNSAVPKEIVEEVVESNNNDEFSIVENPPVQAMLVAQFQLDDETRTKLKAIILPNKGSTLTTSSASSSSSSSADENAILAYEPPIFDAMASVAAFNAWQDRWNKLETTLDALGTETLFDEVLKTLGVESEQLAKEAHEKMRLLDTVPNVDAVFNNLQIKSQIIDKLYSADSQDNLRKTLNQMEFANVKRGLRSAIAFDTVARSVIQKVDSINDKSHIFVLLNALGGTDGSRLLPGVEGRDIEDLPVPESKKEAIVKLILRMQEIK